ncbi:hypothetical protein KSP35_07865 [Aquihabitans sp. G128]|uniref:hypothetical protein n=1 Tax=Aquihabitans sp. G128 TaxID=2849779 RepID=UPI001C23004B|nr:hypothetical protein [Aquihabitans sp. G128]QXC62698.1 hypothetical protein KSP35_07865 [Aquihabitans sp. G128]
MSRAERSARRILFLFPAWLRATRGEEAVALVLDLLPGHAARLPVRSRLDLARAGLHARRIGTPPLWVWLTVLLASPRGRFGTVPLRWQRWASHLVLQRRHAVVLAIHRSVAAGVLVAALAAALRGVGDLVNVPFALVLIAMNNLVGRTADQWRLAVLSRNGLDGEGRPLPPSGWTVSRGWPRCANAHLSTLGTWWLAATLAAAGVAAVFEVREGPAAASAVTAVASTSGAAFLAAVALGLLRRRLRRLDVDELPQPGEEPRRPRLGQLVVVIGAAGLLVARSATLAPMGSWPSIGGVAIAVAGSLAAVALLARQDRRSGRRVGLWELAPVLGPGRVVRWAEPVGPLPSPPAGRRLPPPPARS